MLESARPRAGLGWKVGAMLLVVGGTGQLGHRVVRHLRDQGQQVRCVVRAESDETPLRRLGAQVFFGDLLDPPTLRVACEHIDVVVATATAMTARLGGARHPTIREVDEHGMTALIEAAEVSGVKRFVFVSFAGVDTGFGTPLERAKLATEQRLQRSSMRTVIVRPDGFQEIQLTATGRFDLERSKVAVIGRGDTKRRLVGTDDVAALVAAVSLEPDPPAMLEFGGPEAISRNEAIAVAEAATGRAIKRQRMPRGVARLAMRVLDRPNDALASVFGMGLHMDLVAAEWDDAPLRQRGIVARAASDFIREQARQLGDGA